MSSVDRAGRRTVPSIPADVASLWQAFDAYAESSTLGSDPVLEATVTEAEAAELPAIQVSPLQGRFLELMVRAIGARRVLEVGTLGGYSAICLGRAVGPGGRVVTLEREEGHASVARRALARAGLADRVEVRVGPALESLPRLAAEGGGPFDFTFLDADRPRLGHYLDWAIRLSRPGALIAVDNVVRRGEVLDAASENADVQGVRGMLESLRTDRRVRATVIQTVGRKGHDGFALALVLDPADSAGGGPVEH